MTTGDKAELLPCPFCGQEPETNQMYAWCVNETCGHRARSMTFEKWNTRTQAAGVSGVPEARPLEEWHEDMGDVLWWKFPITEAPYVGSPICLGQTVEVTIKAYGVEETMRVNVGGWPGYHTHFTPIPLAAAPER